MNENVIREICEYLIYNINEDISIDELADMFHYNKFYLIREFKKYTGFTIGEFISYLRVYNSIDPLVFTDDTILKIALNNGFNSLEYYSEKFKAVIGTAPLRFRKVFSLLMYAAKNTDNIDELEVIKGEFTRFKDYQNYLNSPEMLMNIARDDRPKVKALKTTVM